MSISLTEAKHRYDSVFNSKNMSTSSDVGNLRMDL